MNLPNKSSDLCCSWENTMVTLKKSAIVLYSNLAFQALGYMEAFAIVSQMAVITHFLNQGTLRFCPL